MHQSFVLTVMAINIQTVQLVNGSYCTVILHKTERVPQQCPSIDCGHRWAMFLRFLRMFFSANVLLVLCACYR